MQDDLHQQQQQQQPQQQQPPPPPPPPRATATGPQPASQRASCILMQPGDLAQLITAGSPFHEELDYTLLMGGAQAMAFSLDLSVASNSGDSDQARADFRRHLAGLLEAKLVGHPPLQCRRDRWAVTLNTSVKGSAALVSEFGQRGRIITVPSQAGAADVAIPCRPLPPPPLPGQRLLMFRNIPAGSQYDTLAPAILASAGYAPAVVRRGCPPPRQGCPDLVVVLGMRYGRCKQGCGSVDGTTVLVWVLPPRSDPHLRRLPPRWANPFRQGPRFFQTLVYNDPLPKVWHPASPTATATWAAAAAASAGSAGVAPPSPSPGSGTAAPTSVRMDVGAAATSAAEAAPQGGGQAMGRDEGDRGVDGQSLGEQPVHDTACTFGSASSPARSPAPPCPPPSPVPDDLQSPRPAMPASASAGHRAATGPPALSRQGASVHVAAATSPTAVRPAVTDGAGAGAGGTGSAAIRVETRPHSVGGLRQPAAAGAGVVHTATASQAGQAAETATPIRAFPAKCNKTQQLTGGPTGVTAGAGGQRSGGAAASRGCRGSGATGRAEPAAAAKPASASAGTSARSQAGTAAAVLVRLAAATGEPLASGPAAASAPAHAPTTAFQDLMRRGNPLSPGVQQRDARQRQRELRSAEAQAASQRRKSPAPRGCGTAPDDMEVGGQGSARPSPQSAPVSGVEPQRSHQRDASTQPWHGTPLYTALADRLRDTGERQPQLRLDPIFSSYDAEWRGAGLYDMVGSDWAVPLGVIAC